MKTRYIFLPLLVIALLSYSLAGEQTDIAPRSTRRSSLPDNPCDVLSPERMSDITGLKITSAKRVPSIKEIVRAQDESREPGLGTICRYETRSDFGEIIIAVPPQADRHAAKYWEARAKYFETFPGSARPVARLGADAWLAGGNGLLVLTAGGEHFSLSTQKYQRRSAEILIGIAKVVLEQH